MDTSEACLRRRNGRHRGLASSADTRSVTTESDEGTGGRAAGSGAISAGCLWLQSQDPRSSLASRPGAQGRPRPEHRKRRGSSAVPVPGSRYGELRSWCSYIRSAVSVGRSRSDMSTPQKRPSTRHYLLTTSDNRRLCAAVISGLVTALAAQIGLRGRRRGDARRQPRWRSAGPARPGAWALRPPARRGLGLPRWATGARRSR
jgi:hypothetical protein